MKDQQLLPLPLLEVGQYPSDVQKETFQRLAEEGDLLALNNYMESVGDVRASWFRWLRDNGKEPLSSGGGFYWSYGGTIDSKHVVPATDRRGFYRYPSCVGAFLEAANALRTFLSEPPRDNEPAEVERTTFQRFVEDADVQSLKSYMQSIGDVRAPGMRWLWENDKYPAEQNALYGFHWNTHSPEAPTHGILVCSSRRCGFHGFETRGEALLDAAEKLTEYPPSIGRKRRERDTLASLSRCRTSRAIVECCVSPPRAWRTCEES